MPGGRATKEGQERRFTEGRDKEEENHHRCQWDQLADALNMRREVSQCSTENLHEQPLFARSRTLVFRDLKLIACELKIESGNHAVKLLELDERCHIQYDDYRAFSEHDVVLQVPAISGIFLSKLSVIN